MRLIELAVLIVQDGGGETGLVYHIRRWLFGIRLFTLGIIRIDGFVLPQRFGALARALVDARQESASRDAVVRVVERRQLVQRTTGRHVVLQFGTCRAMIKQRKAVVGT